MSVNELWNKFVFKVWFG